MSRRHFIHAAILLGLCLDAAFAIGQPHWNNPKVYRTNALLPHDRVMPDGDWVRSLDGVWAFRFYDTPQQASLHADRWDSIRVPGNIELQGFGTPIYVNMKNEFPSNPPYVPTDYNPTGVYTRTFTLPPHWQGRRTIVKVGAASSAMYLYINGTEVGYSEDSKSPHEWDITRLLRPGTNRITIKVVRWCNGSYMECQDMWRLSGITRSVELYSVPSTYISDLKVLADLDTADYRTGRLEVIVDLNQAVQGGIVEVEVGGIKQRKLLHPHDWFISLTPEVGEVQPWSDSTPTLYPLTVRYYDEHEHLVESISKHIGFRNLHIAHGQLLINGQPIEIRGVNRHEHSMEGGHYVTPAEMRQDIVLMKELGINAVRTCHYPDDELWYDLCDSAGIYLWDEANLETHAQGYGEQSLAKNSEWTELFLDRVYNMYRRDRNHPSVIAWSLGNECGNGVCMEEAYRRLKEYDPTRPVTYERAVLDANTDIVEVMYPSVEYLSEYIHNPSNTRPYIIAEYCHAMGNSMGGLKDYWDTIDKYPQLQGGFIWDWIDQAFLMRGESRLLQPIHFSTNDSLWWAAGGDFGHLFGIEDDDAFCANGILAADRTPHPHAAEVQAVYTRGRYNISTAEIEDTDDLPHVKAHLRLVQNKRGISILNNTFRLLIDPTTGYITSYTLHGHELLKAPLRPNFWRPPTQNDLVDPVGAKAWQGLDQLQAHVINTSTAVNASRDTAEVQMLLHLVSPDDSRIRVKQIIQVAADGRMQLSYMVAADGQFRTMPKLGIQFGIDTFYTGVSFYGNIHETYPDRSEAQRISRWFKSMDDISAPQYVVPQEQGNRMARWVHLASDTLPGITLYSPHDQPMLNFSIRQWNDTVLTRSNRWRGVQPDAYYTVSIDHRVAPLGTATCGPGVAERYIISGDSTYVYRFILGPSPVYPSSPYRDFPPHPDLHSLPPDNDMQRIVITHLSSSHHPSQPYDRAFPSVLTDCQRAVPGDYHHGWAGFSGIDTLLITLSLQRPSALSEISASLCHSPSDWVMRPLDVEVQWSADSVRWSPWQSMTLKNPPSDLYTDSRRLHYTFTPSKAKNVVYVRLRYICRPTLPPWHTYSGEKAWLMLDEVEVRTR